MSLRSFFNRILRREPEPTPATVFAMVASHPVDLDDIPMGDVIRTWIGTNLEAVCAWATFVSAMPVFAGQRFDDTLDLTVGDCAFELAIGDSLEWHPETKSFSVTKPS